MKILKSDHSDRRLKYCKDYIESYQYLYASQLGVSLKLSEVKGTREESRGCV